MPNNATQHPGDTITLQYAADTLPYLRGTVDSNGKFAIAGATTKAQLLNVGGNVDISEDDRGDARFIHAAGTQVMKANAAITRGAAVYAAADGEVAPAGTVLEGYALQAAGADGDLIEVIPVGQVGRHLVLGGTVTVSSGQAAANSGNGRVDIVTGTGVVPTAVHVMHLDASTLVAQTGFDVDIATTPGTIRIDGIAAGHQVDENDVIHWIAIW